MTDPDLNYMPCTSCFAGPGEACKHWCSSLKPKKATKKGDKR